MPFFNDSSFVALYQFCNKIIGGEYRTISFIIKYATLNCVILTNTSRCAAIEQTVTTFSFPQKYSSYNVYPDML